MMIIIKNEMKTNKNANEEEKTFSHSRQIKMWPMADECEEKEKSRIKCHIVDMKICKANEIR